MSARSCDAAVVGGGIIGCAVAHALSRAGLGVTLLERGSVAGEASGAAAGMLAPFAEAEAGSPLLRWGRESLARLPALALELRGASGIDPEWVASGLLKLAATRSEVASLCARAEAGAADGLSWIDREELRRVAPFLDPGLGGALFSRSEGHVRSPLLARAFAGAAEARGATITQGVSVRDLLCEGERVVGVRTSDGDLAAGVVVLCAGSFSAEAAAWRGVPRLPVEPVRGQIVAVENPVPAFQPILWGDAAYLVPKLDGSLVIGATVERVGFDARVTAGGVRRLLQAGRALLPALEDSAYRGAWAGLRPDTPDHLPLVGPLPGVEGLVVAAGHFRNGVLLAPVTAEHVCDGILGKGWAEPAFLPERFLADQTRS